MNDREYLVQQLRNALMYLAVRLRTKIDIDDKSGQCELRAMVGENCVIDLDLGTDDRLYIFVTYFRDNKSHKSSNGILDLINKREGLAHTFVEVILATMRG